MFTNTLKAKLNAGETVYGLFSRYTDAELIEVIGYAAWDFIVFDGEHSVMEARDVLAMTRAAELRGVTPIARVPTNQPATILRFLDTGVHGIHVPWVNTAAEAEAVMRAVKYHPRGSRGLAGVRANDYGFGDPFGVAIQKANTETLAIIHIETIQAVDALPDILAIPDLDVIFIGPNDLAHSMGLAGQLAHAEVVAVMRRIADAVTKTEKKLGIMVRDGAGARQWRDWGARYITVSVESLIMPAFRGYLNDVRG
ncbi:MAG TPA: aldolase/citrate lyase family protein [Aggregatilineales bacterium]|nr:hypothetical protein [Anaerolineales bacterium]HRE46721.1 aldolase/citrate lyase family protein [Aggregatilineales bacterium]